VENVTKYLNELVINKITERGQYYMVATFGF